ncbi:zinc finger BED domain-containing protein 4-like [Toxorhynchites rutilus septentrionalis]|uniref:zinc finger BED domain-containing protein 4-like n=1 Tax=Toxorhynchites rutilus septentrionalis TaxID=329112 RepID=UPI00247A9405|nr:zinc finger BED domain-containing protein 4-like [Toxorhynchites rutilus septentrionalis]
MADSDIDNDGFLQMQIAKIDSMCPTTEPVKQLKAMFLVQHERKFKNIESVDTFAIATLLDPRFKTVYLSPSAHAEALQYVSDIVETENIKPSTVPQAISTPLVFEHGSSNLWEYHNEMVRESLDNQESNPSGDITGELRNFLHQKIVTLDSNPLTIWDSIKSEYPTLYPIARKYLSRMVTSVPAERLFSRTGATAMNRFRLNARRMARLAFMGSLSAEFWANTSS